MNVTQVLERFLDFDIDLMYVVDMCGCTKSFLEEEFAQVNQYLGWLSVMDYDLYYNVLTVYLGRTLRK